MLAIQTDVPPTESVVDMMLLLSKKNGYEGGKRFFRNLQAPECSRINYKKMQSVFRCWISI